MYQLRDSGLLSFVPHLWESASAEAEVIHAYGIEGVGGEPLEIEMGEAANRAGMQMVLESKLKQARAEGYHWTAPIEKDLPDVQLIGVPRLRYRPQTTKTSEWLGDLKDSGPGWINRYDDLLVKAEASSGAHGNRGHAVRA
jgi:hypothetical protein